MNTKASFRSIREEVSHEEWQTRVDLAACYRLVDRYGMTDMIYNHITARVPSTSRTLRMATM
jgi:ribulose-5-phosphate 4-epimerase/fuculose-1-phosphate aldolase